MSDVDNRMYRIIDDYNSQTSEYEGKKRVLSILNAVEESILDFYLNCETISKLIKNIYLKYQVKY